MSQPKRMELLILFHTPASREEVQAWIETLPEGGERLAATVAMGMTWNFLAQAYNNHLDEIEAERLDNLAGATHQEHHDDQEETT